MKKLLALLLVVFTLAACMTVCASAADYRQGDEMTSNWKAIFAFNFKPTDITGAVSVKFDFYVETAANLHVDSFELCSYKDSDWKELNFNNNTGFGGLTDGWNTLTFNIAEGTPNNDTNPDDGTVAGWDPTTFQRMRMYNVSGAGEDTKVAIKNIVAVKEDGTEIKVGLGAAAKENTPIVLDAKNYAEFDSYVIEGGYTKHDGGLYTDGNMSFVMQFPYEGEPTSALLKLPAGNGFLISASKDNETFTEIKRSEVTGSLVSQDLELDLTDYLGTGSIYLKVEDATPADGNGAYINGGAKKTEFSVGYGAAEPETPDTPDTPATFDAVSSVAVAAVAALGVALVASKKRH